MKGSWLGPIRVAEMALQFERAEEQAGVFRVEGPTIERILEEGDVADWHFIEIKPETLCFVDGAARPIVELLKHAYDFRTTAGLPIAERRA